MGITFHFSNATYLELNSQAVIPPVLPHAQLLQYADKVPAVSETSDLNPALEDSKLFPSWDIYTSILSISEVLFPSSKLLYCKLTLKTYERLPALLF